MGTKIEWTDETWNPVTGCTKISPGCQHCYAERIAKRLAGRYGYPADQPFQVTLHPDRLDQPLRWKKPRRVFVCSMSDLFHDDVPDDFLHQIWTTMMITPEHTYQILTKRPKRMRTWVQQTFDYSSFGCLPLPNVHLLVTAENQEEADRRIPELLRTPAAVRGVSVEPMLGPVDFTTCAGALAEPGKPTWPWGIHWVIIGCESGPGRRPMELEWARDLMQQCKAAGVAVFVKQLPINEISDGHMAQILTLNGKGKVSHDPAEWPEDLRVREYPA